MIKKSVSTWARPVQPTIKHKKLRRVGDKHVRIKPIEAVNALIAAKGNQTNAYKLLKPEASEETAATSGNRVMKSSKVVTTFQEHLAAQGMGKEDMVKTLIEATKAGVGKKATNKDTLAGLKLMLDIYGVNTEHEPERDELEKKPFLELIDIAKEQSKKLDLLLRNNAEEGQIEDP